MRKLIVALGLAGALSLAGSVGVFAAAPGGYGSQPGYSVASCDGQIHGSFGAFGGRYNNFAGGADGQLTGANNSGAAAYCQSLR